ncbi:MAG: small, acid-soluble spore protein, alpha/beta type [Bacteroidota bacterium]
MAAGSNNSNTPVVVQARQALQRFRDEVANELNIDTSKIQGGYWGWMTSRDTGAVGGHMVKRMIEAAERSLIEQSAANISAGFAAGVQGKQPY